MRSRCAFQKAMRAPFESIKISEMIDSIISNRCCSAEKWVLSKRSLAMQYRYLDHHRCERDLYEISMARRTEPIESMSESSLESFIIKRAAAIP